MSTSLPPHPSIPPNLSQFPEIDFLSPVQLVCFVAKPPGLLRMHREITDRLLATLAQRVDRNPGLSELRVFLGTIATRRRVIQYLLDGHTQAAARARIYNRLRVLGYDPDAPVFQQVVSQIRTQMLRNASTTE